MTNYCGRCAFRGHSPFPDRDMAPCTRVAGSMLPGNASCPLFEPQVPTPSWAYQEPKIVDIEYTD